MTDRAAHEEVEGDTLDAARLTFNPEDYPRRSDKPGVEPDEARFRTSLDEDGDLCLVPYFAASYWLRLKAHRAALFARFLELFVIPSEPLPLTENRHRRCEHRLKLRPDPHCTPIAQNAPPSRWGATSTRSPEGERLVSTLEFSGPRRYAAA